MAPQFLTPALDIVASFTPLLLYPREISSSSHWIRGRVGPRAALYGVEESSCPCRESNPARPARVYTD
jgi:hypothetical protein